MSSIDLTSDEPVAPPPSGESGGKRRRMEVDLVDLSGPSRGPSQRIAHNEANKETTTSF